MVRRNKGCWCYIILWLAWRPSIVGDLPHNREEQSMLMLHVWYCERLEGLVGNLPDSRAGQRMLMLYSTVLWMARSLVGNLIVWRGSVPDPDPPDPHVFGPSGSGSTSQRYGSGSGSGSFYHHAKIVRKTLIPTILYSFWLFIFEKWRECTFKQ